MSEISLVLVLHLKTNKTLNDMAKIQIQSEKHTPFGDFFFFFFLFFVFFVSIIDSSCIVLVCNTSIIFLWAEFAFVIHRIVRVSHDKHALWCRSIVATYPRIVYKILNFIKLRIKLFVSCCHNNLISATL